MKRSNSVISVKQSIWVGFEYGFRMHSFLNPKS